MAVPKDFIILGLFGVALLFSIIGIAIPRWWSGSSGSIETYYGLWKVCTAGNGNSVCTSYGTTPSRLVYIRALEMIGMLLTAAAILCLLLRKFVMAESLHLFRAIGSCGTTAGVLMIIGCIYFGTASDVTSSGLGAGFALCIIAGLLAIAGGVVQYAVKENQS